MSLSESLSGIIKDSMETRLANVHTALPGKIVKYSFATQLADVQPLLKRKYSDGTLVDLPVISNVPVVHPRTAKAFIHLPLAAGDTVLLVFSERSIDTWLSQGGSVDPGDPRKHHLSDAIAIPGLFAQTSPLSVPNGTDLVVGNDKAKVQLQANGKFLFKNDSDELLDLLVQVVDILTQVQTPTMLGPQPFLPTFVAQLSALKTKLTGMKGS